MGKGRHFQGSSGATNPGEEGGVGGPCLRTAMFAECMKSRWGGWGAKRLLCLVPGSESACHREMPAAPTPSRGASRILALEGKGHSSERMTSFSHEAAAFRTAATPAPATECNCTKKSVVLTAGETLLHSLIWHNYKFPQYVLLCALLFQQKLVLT